MAIIRTPSGGMHAYYRGTEHQRNGHMPDHQHRFPLDRRLRGHPAQPGRRAGRTPWSASSPAPPRSTGRKAKELLDPQPERQPARAPQRTADGPRDVSHLAAWVAAQPEGNRNAGLFWAANRAVEAGDTATLDGLARAARDAGLEDREIDRTIRSAQQTATRGAGALLSILRQAEVREAREAAQPELEAEAS